MKTIAAVLIGVLFVFGYLVSRATFAPVVEVKSSLKPVQNKPLYQTPFQKELLSLTNSERKVPLEIRGDLNDMAIKRAEYLCTHTFSHDGWTNIFESSPYAWIGENLARDFGEDAMATNNALMASPEHRNNILNPNYRFMGIGHTCNISVELFGGLSD